MAKRQEDSGADAPEVLGQEEQLTAEDQRVLAVLEPEHAALPEASDPEARKRAREELLAWVKEHAWIFPIHEGPTESVVNKVTGEKSFVSKPHPDSPKLMVPRLSVNTVVKFVQAHGYAIPVKQHERVYGLVRACGADVDFEGAETGPEYGRALAVAA